MNIRTILLTGILLSVLSGAYNIGFAQEQVEVIFTGDTTLRTLAQEHLGNPNEWKMILHYNGLQNLSELEPDTKLVIPVELYARTMDYLEQTSDTARAAAMQGAKVLAKESINEANRLREFAIESKNAGKLQEAEQAAQEALQWAGKALAEAKEKKIQAVSAILAHQEGSVQSRKPEQPVWLDTLLEQELIEQERVRTLTESNADILFVDGSQISMNENSLAVIGEMRENVIKRSFKAEITVLEGDVLAHLSSLGGQKEFTITAPDIQTTIRSRKFRTSRDESNVTRIANYDGEIDVEANQKKVTVGKDEGTKIERGKGPQAPKKLLPAPVMLSPEPAQSFFRAAILFQWEPVQGAREYQLEISVDRDFTEVLKRIRAASTDSEWQAPQKGLYFYRIYSVDSDDFSGPFSDVLEFYVDIDTLPPFLTVSSPKEGEIVLSCELTIQGTVETGSTLLMNDEPVSYDENGTFSHQFSLTPGEQTLTVLATDKAGNVTTIQRQVVCNTETNLIDLETPQDIVTNLPQVTLKGKLRPHTRVKINGEAVELPQQFSHVLNLPEGSHTITITAADPQGNEQTIPLRMTIDLTPPEITLNKFPTSTKDAELLLSGSVSEAAVLTLNGEDITQAEAEFNLPLPLQEGNNTFVLEAIDSAGNTGQKTIRIKLDTTAPEITTSSCSPTEVKGGEIVLCQVSAQDAGVGLARTANFTIRVTPGNQTVQGVLSFNRKTSRFEGSVFIPPDVKGKIEIQDLKIQDRLGNESVK